MASSMNGLHTGAGRSVGSTSSSQHRRTSHQRQTHTFVNYQAAAMDSAKAQKSRSSVISSGNGATEPRSHPGPIRLSHIQHSATSGVHLPQSDIDMSSAKKMKYHEAVSQQTKQNFDAELARSFAMPLESRDEAQAAQTQPRKVSLAASHPATYGNSIASRTPAPTPSSKAVSCSPDQTSLPALPISSPSPPDLPWRKAPADPTWQTSSEPPYWTRNRTVLKVDANVEQGNVISPTWMIGLPFGCGMTEVADVYPAIE